MGTAVDDQPALSVRAAVSWVRRHTPTRWHEPDAVFGAEDVVPHYAAAFAGIPANSLARDEDVVRYLVDGTSVPALLGLYGSAERVRGWLPGLPRATTPSSVAKLVESAIPPVTGAAPACQQLVDTTGFDVRRLPVLVATPRDAGPYLTMGMVYAQDPETGAAAVSVHRMLVLGRDRLAIWMVPSRRLRAMHEAAVRRGERLAVSVNIAAPPAAMVASALTSAVLPPGVDKLAVAGALAGAPVALAPALSQPTSVLAESEIVLEGYLDATVTDETLGAAPEVSLPEFLGYDGSARSGIPVLTVTAITSRRDPLYQAVIGPGREQSVILGLAGALSAALTTALSADLADARLITDLHYSPAGGGMLLLVVAVRKESPADDHRFERIAARVFDRHGFTKLIIFTDDDVDVSCAEDVLWAVTTRANLAVDCTTIDGFRPHPVDPSHAPDWGRARGRPADGGRSFIDATTPFALREKVFRSFAGVGRTS